MTDGGARVIERTKTAVFERNLAALRRRDPDLAARVEAAPGAEPHAGADSDAVSDLLAKRPHPREALALLGVGDGRVLARLATEGPDEATIGTTRPLFLFEPSAEALACAMRSIDLAPPLELDRLLLFAGPRWRERFEAWLDGPIACAPPRAAARLGHVDQPVVDALNAAHERINQRMARLEAKARAMYSGRTPAETVRRLRAAGARLMLLTTRFSTVLRHSTEDFACGARSAGMRARVVVEPADHCRHTRVSLLEHVIAFEPDLILQIDHHRAENPGLFPEAVPFVCVVQDNLVNLTTPRAGAAMGPTDFATGPWIRTYVREHAYPADRCFETVRLTREPEGAHGPSTGDVRTLLYVSNHSGTPDTTIPMVLEMVGHDEKGKAIAESTAARMIELYEAGGRLENSSDVFDLTREEAVRFGLDRAHPAVRQLTELLSVHVNNALYRQQGLTWAKRAADRLGLTLDVYGNGWDRHPDFADHARGVIAYGDELVRATRSAACCLMLEPFFPTSHQRSIDAWMAGGLVLARARGRDHLQCAFMSWLDRLPDTVASRNEAAQYFESEERDAFIDVCARLHALDPDLGDDVDLVALNMERRRDGVGWLMQLPPEYEAWSFDGPDALEARVRWAVEHPDERTAMCAQLRSWVGERFGYEAGVRRIVDRVSSTLERSA